MYVAFRNLSANNDFKNRLISAWTNSDITHCEIVMTTPYLVAIAARSKTGVTPMSVNQAIGDTTGWLFIEVPAKEPAVYQFLSGQFGADFNYTGIAATQGLGVQKSVPNKWFCSELAYAALAQERSIPLPTVPPASVSPVKLLQMLLEAGLNVTQYPPY